MSEDASKPQPENNKFPKKLSLTFCHEDGREVEIKVKATEDEFQKAAALQEVEKKQFIMKFVIAHCMDSFIRMVDRAYQSSPQPETPGDD